MENTLNLFLVSVSLKTRCTHLSFKLHVGGGLCVSEIPIMLSGMKDLCSHSCSLCLSVFQQQQRENKLRQTLLGRKLCVRLMALADLESHIIYNQGVPIPQAMLAQFKSGFSSACSCVTSE